MRTESDPIYFRVNHTIEVDDFDNKIYWGNNNYVQLVWKEWFGKNLIKNGSVFVFAQITGS